MSSLYIRPFMQKGATVSITPTTTTDYTAVSAVGNRSMRIANYGSALVWFQFGNTVTACSASTGSSMPMLPNSVESFFLPNDVTFVGAVASAASASIVYVTTGESA